MKYVGKAVKRKDDPRLLSGKGAYVGDLKKEGTLTAAFLRSPYAHARIKEINLEKARKIRGVAAVFGPEEGKDIPHLPVIFPNPNLISVTQKPLPEIVHHVGEPVAMVVAESRYIAEDALDAIDIIYEPLPAVAHLEDAAKEDAPIVHEHMDSNIASHFVQSVGDARKAMDEADVVITHRFEIGRVSCLPIETRGILAEWRNIGANPMLEVHAATQGQHEMRSSLAKMFGISENQIRVIAPDVGGAFGAKAIFYVEDVLVPWAAKQVNCPVQWIEDRMEHMMSSIHEREQIHEATLGVTKEGKIVAVMDKMMANNGAYVPWGVVVPILTSTLIPGPYKVPNYLCEVDVYYTNTVPLAPFRGAGRPQAALILNRLLDLAAKKLGMDPLEMKRKNLIQKHEFPYRTGLKSRDGTPQVYDSGDFQGLVRKISDIGEYDKWRKLQKKYQKEGRLIGIGIVNSIENTGYGSFEGATVRMELDGTITVLTGAATQGQSHETTLAQIAAEVFQVPLENVRVLEGDTAHIPYGTGTFASRIATIVGTAVYKASMELKTKALKIAAKRLNTNMDNLKMENGSVRIIRKENNLARDSVSFQELAFEGRGGIPGSTFSYPVTPGLEVTNYYAPQAAAITSMADMAVVEVDPDTFKIKILQYATVHDNGKILNPVVVRGQIHGGVATGIGTAMYEEVIYDKQGQLLTSTLMDYLIPSSMEVPDLIVGHQETLSPLNPLGIKGAGESGTIPVPAVIQSAIEDALSDWGIKLEKLPVKPSHLRDLIQSSRMVKSYSE